MKIKYVFANGEVKWVEVSDEVGQAIIEEQRKEWRNEKKEFRHSACSLDCMDFESEEFADKDTPESLLVDEEEIATLREFMKTLTENQRRRLSLRLKGFKLKQIARIEKVDFRAIKDTFSQIQKKFQTFFKKTLHF